MQVGLTCMAELSYDELDSNSGNSHGFGPKDKEGDRGNEDDDSDLGNDQDE